MSDSGIDDSGIDLAVAVTAIRDQIMAAVASGAGERVKFEVGPIELEFSVELRHDASAKAGVRAWVFSAGVATAESASQIHKVSLTLTPKDSETGGSVLVGNEDAGSTELFGQAT
jgi:hypothetical protein